MVENVGCRKDLNSMDALSMSLPTQLTARSHWPLTYLKSCRRSRRDRSRGRESRISRLSPRLKGDFVLDLLLLGGLRRLEHVRDRLSRRFKASSRLLLIVSTIWRNSATSSSRRVEAATLAEAGLDVVDLGLGGGGARVVTGG